MQRLVVLAASLHLFLSKHLSMKKVILAFALLLFVHALSAQDHVEFRWHGLYSVIDYAYAINVNDDPAEAQTSFSELTGVVGFQLRKETALGLGVTYFSDPTNAYTQMPVFLEYRSHFTRNRLTPFTALQLGYNVPIGHSSGGNEGITITKGGVFFGANLGARFAITRNVGLSLFGGYQLMLMNEVEYKHAGLLAERKPVLFHILRIGAGINF